MPLPPIGFWSYTRTDDETSRGRLSGLRALLLAQLKQKMGRLEVRLFQDVAAIPPGTEWQKQIDSAVRESSFMIPIITPGLLHSPYCAEEINRFRVLMEQRGRDDLIMPILFGDIALFHTVRREEIHEPALFDYLRTLQWVDFTKLETKTLDSPEVHGWVLAFASRIVEALYREVPRRGPEPPPIKASVVPGPDGASSTVAPSGATPSGPGVGGQVAAPVIQTMPRPRSPVRMAVLGVGLLGLGIGIGAVAVPWVSHYLAQAGSASGTGSSQTAVDQNRPGTPSQPQGSSVQPPAGASGLADAKPTGSPPPAQPSQTTPSQAAAGPASTATADEPKKPAAARPLPRCEVCPEMVLIPKGSFRIGDDTWPNSQPFLDITFKQPFYMAKYPVTVGEYRIFLDRNPSHGADLKWKDPAWTPNPREPAVHVSHTDALAYIAWLNRVIKDRIDAGRESEYRLPTETEWEYAARAGTQTDYFWGDRFEDGARYIPPRGKGAVPAETLDHNQFGLYGMLGLVWQWVEDPWHDDYKGLPTDGSVWRAGGDPVRRVLRGGSWNVIPRGLRAGGRSVDVGGNRDGKAGFRPARTSFSP